MPEILHLAQVFEICRTASFGGRSLDGSDTTKAASFVRVHGVQEERRDPIRAQHLSANTNAPIRRPSHKIEQWSIDHFDSGAKRRTRTRSSLAI